MPFVVKHKQPTYHNCGLPDPLAPGLVPGDMWRCDKCKSYYVYALYYSSNLWYSRSRRQAERLIKRHNKGKPFKRKHTGRGAG